VALTDNCALWPALTVSGKAAGCAVIVSAGQTVTVTVVLLVMAH
jgi:hypothetical protein